MSMCYEELSSRGWREFRITDSPQRLFCSNVLMFCSLQNREGQEGGAELQWIWILVLDPRVGQLDPSNSNSKQYVDALASSTPHRYSSKKDVTATCSILYGKGVVV